MSAPLRNLLSEQKLPPFQVSKILGRDFNALTLLNYNYYERWIFPSNFTARLELSDAQIPVVRSFRYNSKDKADKAELKDLEPTQERLDRDITYFAKVQELHNLFIQTMQQQSQKNGLTIISLDPLSITLRVGSIQAALLLEEITDAEQSQHILKRVFED